MNYRPKSNIAELMAEIKSPILLSSSIHTVILMSIEMTNVFNIGKITSSNGSEHRSKDQINGPISPPQTRISFYKWLFMENINCYLVFAKVVINDYLSWPRGSSSAWRRI